jgi:hypothetical protein
MALLVPIVAGCAGAPLNPVPGAAPYEAELDRAAAAITPAAVLERISVIAHDSMGGRNTPSPGLEMTAEYFAGKYREWGIQPAGENGTYFQRYPMVRKTIVQSESWLEADENGTITRYPMGDWGFVASVGSGHVAAPLVILGGTLTDEAIGSAALEGKIAMLIVDAAKAADWGRWTRAIRARNPAGIVHLRNDDEAMFTRMVGMRSQPGGYQLDMAGPSGRTEIYLHDNAFRNDPMAANRPDFGQMRHSSGPVIQEVPEQVRLTLHAVERIDDRITVPNVVGMIPGSDPSLAGEYVVYSAHMDHVGTAGDGIGGCRANPPQNGMPADSICNGADDDASGSTAVLSIAHAYSLLKVTPRRSIVFLHVSGEEKGLLGSRWYSEHPTVPGDQIIANINMDMVGRNNPDSIVVIGKEHSDMGTTLARVNSRHIELGLTTADDIWPQERFYFRSDHFNFARKGVPVLFFFNGVHPQCHRADDHVELIDTGKLSRVSKIGFYLGAEIANTLARPQWNPESYTEIVEGPGR